MFILIKNYIISNELNYNNKIVLKILTALSSFFQYIWFYYHIICTEVLYIKVYLFF